MLIHLTYISIILILLAYILIPKIAKAIRENDEAMWEDWEETDSFPLSPEQFDKMLFSKYEHLLDEHPFINGDCCRCPECTERYQKELKEDLK